MTCVVYETVPEREYRIGRCTTIQGILGLNVLVQIQPYKRMKEKSSLDRFNYPYINEVAIFLNDVTRNVSATTRVMARQPRRRDVTEGLTASGLAPSQRQAVPPNAGKKLQFR